MGKRRVAPKRGPRNTIAEQVERRERRENEERIAKIAITAAATASAYPGGEKEPTQNTFDTVKKLVKKHEREEGITVKEVLPDVGFSVEEMAWTRWKGKWKVCFVVS